MKRIICMAIISGLAVFGTYAGDTKGATENKNVTLVSASANVDGKSDINEKLLEECIVSLPSVDELEAEVTSSVGYVKEINGDPGRNDFVKMYSAIIEINYMLHQQSIIIVTTASVQGQEPVMKVVDKTLRQSKTFESNPTEGDNFAGRSDRRYYFPTADAAIKDVKRRAAIWLKQQSAVLCSSQPKAPASPKK